jgi:hypothetical protein
MQITLQSRNRGAGASACKRRATLALLLACTLLQAQTPPPIQVLAQSPAGAHTDLQVICLFASAPANTLHGSLTEINEKLKGLLDRIRKPQLFRGDLGETLLLTPPQNSLGAKRLLLIGLGDSQTFSPQRMQLVGRVLYQESTNLGVAQPFFAPTILDGGVDKFTTGEVAEQLILGFLNAAATEQLLRDANAAIHTHVSALTYLAGAKHIADTQAGVQKAITAAVHK